MARKQRSGLTQHFRRLIGQLIAGSSHSGDHGKSRRQLNFEPLEDRQLMASDLASISGIVSLGGPITGATVNLYVDDGDGIFEPGAGDGAAIVDLTDGTGTYRFDGLVAGAYWIEQPAQTVGTTDLGQFVAPLINISAGQAAGVLGTSIDDFADAIAQQVTADTGTPTNSGAADHLGAIGGERDMIVTLTSGGAGESVTLDSQSGRLLFNSTNASQGDFTVVYDGDDNDGATLAATGLGGVNLTAGSATSIKAQVQADQANATLRIRVYTNATDYSDSSTFVIPGTNVATDVVFDFTDFALGAGATNPANFSSVGAIEVVVETNTDGTDGRVNLLGAFGPTVITQDISNELDLAIQKNVDDSTPGSGQPVTFTIEVTNSSASQTATNVVLTDTFDFTTLSGVVTTPEAGTNFVLAGDNQSGTWTIPTLAPGATATLIVTGNNISTAQRTNTIALTSLDQIDTNSANDSDSEQLTPTTLDLVVDKQVNDNTPNNGQSITFTMTVTNSSATETATNVVLTDTFDFTTLSGVVTTPQAGTNFVLAGNNQSGTWTIPTLAAGATATLIITGNNTSATQRTNTITLTSLDQFDTDDANNSDNQQLTPNTLDLVVDKQVNDATPNNGQSITFTMTVTNSSATETATNVVLTDTFDFTTLSGVVTTPQAGTTFVIAGNNQSGTWTIPTLAPGAVATLTITGNNISPAQRTNTIALASLDQFDTNAQNNTDGAQLTPSTLDLVVGKQVTDNTPNKNQSITFTMTVTNSSATETATNVVLTDTFDFTTLSGLVTTAQGGTTFVLAGNNQSGTWTIPTLAPGAVATLTITGNNNSAVQRTNTIALTTLDQFDTSAANNTANQQLTPTRADLRLAKAVIGPTAVEPGQTVTFRLTLTNDGPDQATGVAVTDTLPAGLSLVNGTASQGTFVSGVWTVGTLNSGASATLDIVATLTTAGPKTNVAEVTAADQFDPDSTPGDNTGDDRASANVTSTRLSKRRFLAR